VQCAAHTHAHTRARAHTHMHAHTHTHTHARTHTHTHPRTRTRKHAQVRTHILYIVRCQRVVSSDRALPCASYSVACRRTRAMLYFLWHAHKAHVAGTSTRSAVGSAVRRTARGCTSAARSATYVRLPDCKIVSITGMMSILRITSRI
jgi:hypothetical protein